MLKNQSQFEIYLASTSPRRIEILSQILRVEQEEGQPVKGFRLIKPDFEEDLDKSKYTPQEYVEATALHKFKSINTMSIPTNSIVISADTIISFQGKVIEKPKSKDDQLSNLINFVENSKDEGLKVITCVIVYDKSKDQINRFTELTSIIFDHDISKDVIQSYVDSEDGLKVAGGFKIQSIGGVLIKEIQGDYYNVVGLPLNATFKVLRRIIDN